MECGSIHHVEDKRLSWSRLPEVPKRKWWCYVSGKYEINISEKFHACTRFEKCIEYNKWIDLLIFGPNDHHPRIKGPKTNCKRSKSATEGLTKTRVFTIYSRSPTLQLSAFHRPQLVSPHSITCSSRTERALKRIYSFIPPLRKTAFNFVRN